MLKSTGLFVLLIWLLLFSLNTQAQIDDDISGEHIGGEQISEPTPVARPVDIDDAADGGLLSVPVTYRERIIFELYFSGEDEREESLKKASQAGQLLDKALHASQPLSPEAPMSQVIELGKKRLEVQVRGYKIADLDKSNFEASGSSSWEQYRDQLQAQVANFVSDELDRIKIQSGALKFFLSVFFALLGFIMLRQVHRGFGRAELALERRRESFKPIALLSETLISGQTVGGLWAIILITGRMLAYLVVILTTLAAVLGQFAYTRTIMTKFFADIFKQIFESLQSLVEAIPGLLLSLALILLLQLSLQVLNLLLKGVRTGRISWGFLTSSRVPVVSFWSTALLIILFGPLIVASTFGKFHTPLENIFLLIAAVFALSALPLLVNIVAGSLIIWQGKIVPGQWIEVCGRRGEVASVTLLKVTIVPDDGGRVFIPMTLFLYNSCFDSKHMPRGEFRVQLIRTKPLAESTEQLKSLFPKDLEVDVVCLSASAKEYHFALFAPKFQNEIRRQILTILSDAHERGEILLNDTPIEEISH